MPGRLCSVAPRLLPYRRQETWWLSSDVTEEWAFVSPYPLLRRFTWRAHWPIVMVCCQMPGNSEVIWRAFDQSYKRPCPYRISRSRGSIKGPITGKICAFGSVTSRLMSCNFNELRDVAEMAWKRSSVRSRSGPPTNQQLASSLL
jgi:hypothetical protein